MDQYKAHTNLNAVTYIDEAKLAEDARAIDRSRAQGAQLALAGLPIIIKDNINTAGFPTTAGTPFLKNYRPKANAPLADMLLKQGAILFAKSNMHELALGSTSANPTFGYVKNPYDLSRIPGGSNQGDRPLMNCAATSLLLRNADQRRATFCADASMRPVVALTYCLPQCCAAENIRDCDIADDRFGSNSAIELRDRRGGTCSYS